MIFLTNFVLSRKKEWAHRTIMEFIDTKSVIELLVALLDGISAIGHSSPEHLPE